jgi:hypothetical protein
LPNGDYTVIADLVIYDGDLIEHILRGGRRGTSVGYNFDLQETTAGDLVQCNIRANHLAIVPEGRAGEAAQIMDSNFAEEDDNMSTEEKLDQETALSALEHLHKLRPLLERSGNRKAMDAYTAAVDTLSRRARRPYRLAAADRTGPHAGEAEDFEANARRYHRKDFHIRSDQEQPEEMGRTALDAPEELSFDELIRRRRMELLSERKAQR